MQTKTVSSRLALLAIAVTAALVAQPVFGQGTSHQLVVTENSSKDLSVIYDGSTITPTFVSPDNWIVTLPSTVQFFGDSFKWVEPENSGLGNAVNLLATSNQFTVFSDQITNFLPKADESTVNNVGIDSNNAGPISITFDDDGDVAAAPDTGTTWMLLLLGVTATFGLKFFVRREA